MITNPQSPLLTPKEVAAILDCTPRTAARLMRDQKVPSVKIGKGRYTHRDTLDAYMRGGAA